MDLHVQDVNQGAEVGNRVGLRTFHRSSCALWVEGIRTNTPLHRDLVRDKAFEAGGVSIHYLESKLEDK